MTPPPPRFAPNALTLAHARGLDGGFIALVHEVRPRRESFVLAYCRPDWRAWHWSRFDRLEMALLAASERDGVRMADWARFEPPRGVKLYVEKPQGRLRRRHVRARNDLYHLWWGFRRPERSAPGEGAGPGDGP